MNYTHWRLSKVCYLQDTCYASSTTTLALSRHPLDLYHEHVVHRAFLRVLPRSRKSRGEASATMSVIDILRSKHFPPNIINSIAFI